MKVVRAFLPSNIRVREMDHDKYIKEALDHPFIAYQVSLGIYSPDTISDEFLSVAKSIPQDRLILIDTHLIAQHMHNVDIQYATAYCASIALHEYHHIEHHQSPASTPAEQALREVECNEWLALHHPSIMTGAEKAEEVSETIQRVYRRIEAIESAMRP